MKQEKSKFDSNIYIYIKVVISPVGKAKDVTIGFYLFCFFVFYIFLILLVKLVKIKFPMFYVREVVL